MRFYTRSTSIILFMKRHQVFIAFLVSLIGLIIAFPKKIHMQIQQHTERLTSNFNYVNNDVFEKVDYKVCSADPEEEMTTIDIIRKSGYPAEEHFVQTEDGYILTLHRIPGNKRSPMVLLQHALLESSFCWVISGKQQGLAYILANKGYDVWMGNVRGNTYSKNHTILSTSDSTFWNFSWHEMGIYDVPAEIEYITSLKNESLIYIGHSMGTTIFYVMASERPDIASKVKAMFGFAPVTFTDNIRGLFFPLGLLLGNLQKYTNLQGTHEFFGQNAIFKFAAKCICNRPVINEICRDIIFSSVGFNPKQFNLTMLPLILTHTPAGTSLKTVIHFAQGILSKKFIQYDYGSKINVKMYKSKNPPEYDLSKIQVPIELFWGENDFLAQRMDMLKLYEKQSRKVNIYIVDEPLFNHLDFIWGINASNLIYSKLLLIMEKYRQ